jgi:SAM-dependent methyltransferase
MSYREVCRFLDFPFHIGAQDAPYNDGLPNSLPFTVAVWEPWGLVCQGPSEQIEATLESLYSKGSMIGSPLSPQGPGRRYADEFVDFVGTADSLKGKSLLEVGCGSGYLASRFSEVGARVIGVEPGQPWIQGQVFEVRIIRDFFPCPPAREAGPFDRIVHYCVLEHICEPAEFLAEQVASLSPGGRLVFAVPDVEEYLMIGDPSVFVHEHWSYFTPNSLHNLLASLGLQVLRLQRSTYGKLLFVEAALGPTESKEPDNWDSLGADVDAFVSSLSKFLSEVEGTVGVLPGGRLLNSLWLSQPQIWPRFYDDDPRLLGKYLPPIPVAIQATPDLLRNPVNNLLIPSLAFGPGLKAELQKEPALEDCRILLPDEF